MRGKGIPSISPLTAVRITPAYAGKSQSHVQGFAGKGDHPRVCGEKPDRQQSPPQRAGSPPRMRGKGIPSISPLTAVRITPAYAGKSQSHVQGFAGKGDHPRVCGEKPDRQQSPPQRAGSPPRMRGKAVSSTKSMVSSRITPAYAGKSYTQF